MVASCVWFDGCLMIVDLFDLVVLCIWFDVLGVLLLVVVVNGVVNAYLTWWVGW